MRDMSESQNRALRNRPTFENTKEVLELVRSQEKDVNSNVLFDEVLLRRASTSRPNEPLPSIRVGPSMEVVGDTEQDYIGKTPQRGRSSSDTPILETRDRSPRSRRNASSPMRNDKIARQRRISTTSCPDRLGHVEENYSTKYRWRSSSDAPLMETMNRSPRNCTSTSPARRVSLKTNLPPLNLELETQRVDRPSCPVGVPSRSRKEPLLSPDEDFIINTGWESEDEILYGSDHS